MSINLYYDHTVAWIAILDDNKEYRAFNLNRDQLFALAVDAINILEKMDHEANYPLRRSLGRKRGKDQSSVLRSEWGRTIAYVKRSGDH